MISWYDLSKKKKQSLIKEYNKKVGYLSRLTYASDDVSLIFFWLLIIFCLPLGLLNWYLLRRFDKWLLVSKNIVK